MHEARRPNHIVLNAGKDFVMKVRDLMEQLQRFEPSQEVKVTAEGRAYHPSGISMQFEVDCNIDKVKAVQGEAVIVAYE